jgi:hypothetical protein
MKIQKGDIFDRLSILILKITHNVEIEIIKDELSELLLEFEVSNLKEAESFINLLNTNKNIWNLESDIRQGKENELGLEEVGRRALAIRDFNKQRIAFKNSISQNQEIKINHLSE